MRSQLNFYALPKNYCLTSARSVSLSRTTRIVEEQAWLRREVWALGLMLGMELDSADKTKEVVNQLMLHRSDQSHRMRPCCAFCSPTSLRKSTSIGWPRELDIALSSGSSIRVTSQLKKSTVRSHN